MFLFHCGVVDKWCLMYFVCKSLNNHELFCLTKGDCRVKKRLFEESAEHFYTDFNNWSKNFFQWTHGRTKLIGVEPNDKVDISCIENVVISFFRNLVLTVLIKNVEFGLLRNTKAFHHQNSIKPSDFA